MEHTVSGGFEKANTREGAALHTSCMQLPPLDSHLRARAGDAPPILVLLQDPEGVS